MSTPETLRQVAPDMYELVGARTFTLPSRSNGAWHVVLVHDDAASCRLHANRCWAARKALNYVRENPEGH